MRTRQNHASHVTLRYAERLVGYFVPLYVKIGSF